MTFKVAAIPSRIKIGESIQEQSAFIALALASTLLNFTEPGHGLRRH